MFRAALFTAVGVVWLVNSLNRLTDPDNQHPESASDWVSVLSFSTGLFVLALALPILAGLIDGQLLFRVSLVAAAGAALAGLSNLVEDGLQLGWAFWPFILGSLSLVAGLMALTVAGAIGAHGRLRLLAAVPASILLDVLVLHKVGHAFGGGVAMSAAWLGAAAMALGHPAGTRPQSAPASP